MMMITPIGYAMFDRKKYSNPLSCDFSPSSAKKYSIKINGKYVKVKTSRLSGFS
jgi:hypothetical protein